LEQLRRDGLEHTLREKLKATASVRMLLEEPEPPALNIGTDDDPSRGAPNAPVTLVVFSDFQCPSCGANHPMIEETVNSYGNQVRLVYRDFPLAMHENARKAAEAANAAFAQGKYFEYAEVLFKNQKALDVASLKKYATEVGLNRARFDAALDSGAYAAEVNHDIADGQQYGVVGTPTVFVNGVRVNNLSDETLRAAIDRALAQKRKTAATPPTAPASATRNRKPN
jgi:protein-disulfide isomerase